MKDCCITKVHSSVGAKLTEAGNVEYTPQPAGSSTGWRASLPGGSAGLCFFQASCLNVFHWPLYLEKEGLSESGQFQELHEAVLIYFLSLRSFYVEWKLYLLFNKILCLILTSFPSKWKILISEEIAK